MRAKIVQVIGFAVVSPVSMAFERHAGASPSEYPHSHNLVADPALG